MVGPNTKKRRRSEGPLLAKKARGQKKKGKRNKSDRRPRLRKGFKRKGGGLI